MSYRRLAEMAAAEADEAIKHALEAICKYRDEDATRGAPAEMEQAVRSIRAGAEAIRLWANRRTGASPKVVSRNPTARYQCVSRPGECKFEWNCGPCCACHVRPGTGSKQEAADEKEAERRQEAWRKEREV